MINEVSFEHFTDLLEHFIDQMYEDEEEYEVAIDLASKLLEELTSK